MSLKDAPTVLIVQHRDGELWEETQERNFERGTVTTFRRAKLYVRAEDHPRQPEWSVYTCTWDNALLDALPIEDLAKEIGRQAALALKAQRRRGKS